MNINEINEEIKLLEQADTNYQNCNKLAVLYCVSDHLSQMPVQKSKIAAHSEFINAFSNATIDYALSVMDEHMECVKALYPKEYAAIIDRLKK